MKTIYHKIALHTGGAHYPEVGGKLLEQFGDTVIDECLSTINERTISEVHTDWEIGYNTALRKIAEDIKTKFGV